MGKQREKLESFRAPMEERESEHKYVFRWSKRMEEVEDRCGVRERYKYLLWSQQSDCGSAALWHSRDSGAALPH